MAYITHKSIKGHTYYYAQEMEWKDGKPRRKWQKYLGTLQNIMAAADGFSKQPKYADVFQLGSPAAYLNIAEEIDAMGIINNVLTKRDQGLSLGFYITLAAINRGIDPRSKRAMWQWFQDTILLRKFPEANKTNLSSQRFWDNMSTIKEDKIQHVWMKLINNVLDKKDVDLSSVSYDGTNFYSFIGSFNMKCSIAKRGKNKQGRKELRQINYALFCTRKDHIPLYFDVYEGNRHDAKEFEVVIDKFLQAFKHKKLGREGMTIVFDKGNNSETNLGKFMEDSPYHFVGSVKPTDHKDLGQISNSDKCFTPLSDPQLEEVKAFRKQKMIYGKTMTTVVTFNNNLYTAQVQSIHNEINKCLDKLSVLSEKLEDRRSGVVTKGKKPTTQSVQSQISSIVSGQHMKTLIKTTITEYNNIPTIEYSVDHKAFSDLSDTYLGKNIIMTDNHHWSNEEIILSYRSQYVIEEIFKQMKDRKIGGWWPMFHWTDRMIRVHGLYCSIALLLRALIMKKTKDAGISISMNKLHDKLSGMREVVNIFGTKRKKEVRQSVLSKLDPLQKRLLEIFQMNDYLRG